MMSPKVRIVSLLAVGLTLRAGAASFPLDRVIVPTWHDHLTVDVNLPGFPHTARLCVSDFEVMSERSLRFTVERDRGPTWVAGKRYTVAAGDFTLQENTEGCPQRT